MKRPTWGRFAPPSQVPPLSFSLSFSFQFPFNLNYETKRLKTGSRTSATNNKQRTKKKSKKQRVSQKIDLVMRIQTVQESSKLELSSSFFGHLKSSTQTAGQLFFLHAIKVGEHGTRTPDNSFNVNVLTTGIAMWGPPLPCVALPQMNASLRGI